MGDSALDVVKPFAVGAAAIAELAGMALIAAACPLSLGSGGL
jgi:hypothetical protein